MSNFNFSDCRKATNQAIFRPTKSRKALAVKLLSEALDFINNLEEVADKPSKKAGKKRRRKTTKRTPSQKVADSMDRAALKTNEVGPIEPSKKAKTASVKEAAAAAKAVSVATGAAAKAAKKAELKAQNDRELVREAVRKNEESLKTPKVAKPKAKVYKPNGQPNQVELDKRFAALDEKLAALTAVLALQMESTIPSTANEVSLDELPFEL